MLAPIPPRPGIAGDKQRHQRDLKDMKNHPRKYGQFATVPAGVAAAGSSERFSRQQAELEQLRRDKHQADAQRERADRRTRCAAAIAAMLLNGEDFGKDGKPQVARIAAVGKMDISSGDRDESWALMQSLAAAHEPRTKR